MRIVVDSNQLDPIRRCRRLSRRQKQNITLVLPGEVLIEQLRGRFAANRLLGAAEFNLRFGLSPGTVLTAIGNKTAAQIRQFDPVIPYGARHRLLKHHLADAPVALHPFATQQVEDNRDWVEGLRQKLTANKKEIQDAKSRGESLESWNAQSLDAAYDKFFADENSPLGSWFASAAQRTDKSVRSAASAAELVTAARTNPYIRMFGRVLLAMHLGYANVWTDPNFKGRISPNPNDKTDATLALYANAGDVILTADGKFRDLMRLADPNCSIEVATWSEWIERRT